MTTHTGSCHCGKIAFEVDGEIEGAMACNCSICRRKGVLMWFVPRANLRLLTDEKDMSTYLFNKHVIRHHFCPTCGMHPFGEAPDPKGNATAAVNLRCVDGVDFDALKIQHFDGASR